MDLYYLGFLDLMSDRQIGFDLGGIWWNTVEDYCVKKGLDEEQTAVMHYHIVEMDKAYLKIMRKKK